MENINKILTIGGCIENFITENKLSKNEVCSRLKIDLSFLESNIKKSGLAAKQIYDNMIIYYSKENISTDSYFKEKILREMQLGNITVDMIAKELNINVTQINRIINSKALADFDKQLVILSCINPHKYENSYNKFITTKKEFRHK